MSTGRIFILLTATILSACTDSPVQKNEAVFKQIPEIQEIKPERPVKIKLKRNAKDDYSWEITGEKAQEIVQADRELRKGLKGD